MNRKRRLVYTASVGQYLHLPEVEVEDGVEYWVLTTRDWTELRGNKFGNWKAIYGFTQASERRIDFQLKHRELKILAIPGISQFDSILYVDPTVELLSKPSLLMEEFEKCRHSICLVAHSFRKSLRDEFKEVFCLGLDYPVTVFDQYHSISGKKDLSVTPVFWGGMFWTDNSSIAQAFREKWFKLVCSGSARDQLSLPLAIDGIGQGVVHLDNRHSQFHKWPLAANQVRIWNRRYGFTLLAKFRFGVSYVLRKLLAPFLFSDFLGQNHLRRRLARWVLLKSDLDNVWD